MRTLEFRRFALCISLAAVLLSACGGSSVPIATGNTIDNAGAAKGNKTFKYTGSEQMLTVPKGVTQLTVVARGGEGAGTSMYPSTNTPGHRAESTRSFRFTRARSSTFLSEGPVYTADLTAAGPAV